MKRLLLHCCCGPCSSAVIERLRERYDLSLYWFNPNIQPEDEYQRRLQAMKALAHEFEMPLEIEEGAEAEWEAAVAGCEDEPEGASRCSICYAVRLAHAARQAGRSGCEVVATTLSISPHKRAEHINAAAQAVCETGVDFLAEDFKTGGGFQRSVQLAKALGLYRQRYCGCRFSKR
jgi:hypothetical protein